MSNEIIGVIGRPLQIIAEIKDSGPQGPPGKDGRDGVDGEVTQAQLDAVVYDLDRHLNDYADLKGYVDSHLADYATFKEGENKKDPLFTGSTGVDTINLTGNMFDYKFIEIRVADPSDSANSRSAVIFIPIRSKTTSYPLVFNGSFGYIRLLPSSTGTQLDITSMGPASDMRVVAVTGIFKIT